MQISGKLSQKGLVLVCLVLVVQLGIVFGLLNCMNEAEVEAARQARAKEIVARTNGLIHKFYDAGVSLKGYIASIDPDSSEKYRRLIKEIPQEIAWLKESMRGNKKAFKSVQRIEKHSKKMISLLKEAKRVTLEGDMDKVQKFVHQFREDLQPTFDALVLDVDVLIDSQQDVLNESPRLLARARANTRTFLFVLIGGNILIAIVLAGFFLNSITSRINLLVDNTRRLAAGENLNPEIETDDEIGQLDSVFHKMADELHEARRKERTIFENVQDVICALDEDGRFVEVSSASKAAWGVDEESLLGRRVADIIVEEDSESVWEKFLEAKNIESKSLFEVRIKAKGDDCLYSLWNVHWVSDEKTYFCVAHDITERQKLEKMKQSFVAMVSHELRTPLTSVQNYLGMLNMGILGEISDKAKDRGADAEKSVNRLIGLINDLLDLEKMEQGKLSINITEANTGEIMKSAHEAVSGFAEKHEINLDIDKSDIGMRADPGRLIQVLTNLISNAVKFSPAGSTVKVALEESLGSIEFKVIDKGEGIAEEDLPLVFERFHQVSKQKQEKEPGTGLGLAICKSIVEGHGGTIGVDSKSGVGSTFWFRIPINIEE